MISKVPRRRRCAAPRLGRRPGPDAGCPRRLSVSSGPSSSPARKRTPCSPEARKALAYYLAEYSARYRGVSLPEEQPMARRSATWCAAAATLAPDAYLFTVIDRAIIAEASKLPKR